MDLSIVIPCFNEESRIGTQLEALAGQDWSGSWEVLIADGGSTDGTRDVVESYRGRLPGLRFVNRRAGTVAAGQNVAVDEARGRWIGFVDADDEVGEGWIAAMADALETHPVVSSVQDVWRLNAPWIATSREHYESLLPALHPPYLPHACGSGMAVWRSAHDAIGGFDESLPGLHDNDYCWRLQMAGYSLHKVQDAVLHYRYRDTLRGIYRQGRSYAMSDAQLQCKYGGPPGGKWKWPLVKWKPIVLAIPRLHRRSERAQVAWLLGWQIGRLKGSVTHRVLAM